MKVAEAAIMKVKSDTIEWAENFKAEIGASGASGAKSWDGSQSKTDAVDKKDVAVWKLQDSASKPDVRHLLDIIDSNLDAVHYFRYPEVIFDKLRKSGEEVTTDLFGEIILQATDEVKK